MFYNIDGIDTDKKVELNWYYYPLAQQNCGGDTGSVPYVRSFVCSPFVSTLATSFIIQFRYNFTQVLGMTIPRRSSRYRMIGSRSRSQ